MSEIKFVTLYRYRYHDKEAKVDKFEYCELVTGRIGGDRYDVYRGPNRYLFDHVVYMHENNYYPSLDNMSSNYIMWSLSPDKKDKFLLEVREMKYEKLKDLLAKADKFRAEIDWMDKELLDND